MLDEVIMSVFGFFNVMLFRFMSYLDVQNQLNAHLFEVSIDDSV